MNAKEQELTNLHHLPLLFQVPRYQVNERETLKVFGPLVGKLNNLKGER